MTGDTSAAPAATLADEKFVDVPAHVLAALDQNTVRIVDAGDEDPLQRCTHVHFYTCAAAVLIEDHVAKLQVQKAASKCENSPGGS